MLDFLGLKYFLQFFVAILLFLILFFVNRKFYNKYANIYVPNILGWGRCLKRRSRAEVIVDILSEAMHGANNPLETAKLRHRKATS